MPDDKPGEFIDRLARRLLGESEHVDEDDDHLLDEEDGGAAPDEVPEEQDTQEHETLSEGRTRPQTGTVETRRHELALEGKKIRGLIPFNTESRDLGGWTEVISPLALRDANLDELVARVDHAGVPIDRYPKTLTLEERGDGLHWSVTPPESRADVREAIERGDLRAGSWQMVVGKDRWAGDVRHVERIEELRDVSVVSSPAYPAAAVEYRAAPTTTKEDQVSESNTSEERPEGERSEDNESTEERSSLPNSAGSLRVEERTEAFGNTSLTQLFESRGFPAEKASVSWGEYRGATWGGTVDLLNPNRVDGVPLGADTRWAYPAFPSVAVGAGVTSVQIFRQDSRTIPAGTVVSAQYVGGTVQKAEVSTAGSVLTTTLHQVAGIESNIPNAYLETAGFASLVETDLRLAVNGGLDALVTDGIASCGYVSPGTNPLLISIRNAAGSVEAAGYSPNTVLLPSSDAIALDTLRVSGTASEDYVFAAANFAPRTLFGMTARTYGGTATVVCDSTALGKLYASPVTLARFEVDAGATNRSNIRLECNAAFPVERTGAAARIAYS